MSFCPDCGAEIPSSGTVCECGRDLSANGESDGSDPEDEYVRKIRELPYREQLAVRFGLRNADEIEMVSLSLGFRLFLLAFRSGLVAFGLLGFLNWGPYAMTNCTTAISCLFKFIVNDIPYGNYLFGSFFVLLGLLEIPVVVAGRRPKHTNGTDRDLLP